MKKYLKTVLSRIYSDWSQSKYGILAAGACLFLFTLLFKTGCPFRLITGLPCPGCGMTRSAVCLLMGNFTEALKLNPSIFLWCTLLVYIVAMRYFLGKGSKTFVPLTIAVSLATLGVYIYRMAFLFPGEEPLCYHKENLLAFFKNYSILCQ